MSRIPEEPSGPQDQDPPQTEPSPGAAPIIRPKHVTTASVIWIVFGVLLVLSAFQQFGQGPEPPPPGVSARPDADAQSTLDAIVFMILGAATVVLAVYMRKGSNGARIAVTVLGAITLIGIVSVVLVVPAIVFQFLPASNAWFRAVKAGRPYPPPSSSPPA